MSFEYIFKNNGMFFMFLVFYFRSPPWEHGKSIKITRINKKNNETRSQHVDEFGKAVTNG